MGIEDFQEMRTSGYYYIDKTGMIRDLLENMGKVTLFTRPRRFGKTLNMSMLKYFFEVGSEREIFDGLEISAHKELCDRYMGRFPVLSISLKGVSGTDLNGAKGMLRSIIGNEALRFQFLLQSEALSATERKQYRKLIELNDAGEFSMSDGLLKESLLMLTRFLHKYYGQKAIVLIDEYDVPLDKAYQGRYYDDMVELLRALFGQVLKTNGSLYFAVLTGCLRISRESIFTGLNNLNVYTIKNIQYNTVFGFTDAEVREMLSYYEFMEKYEEIKEWYDGYRFCGLGIYCPWDVVSYCHALKMNPSVAPQNYWVNTSGNDIIRRFIEKADAASRDEIERLIAGDSIEKEIHHELTYRDLDLDMDHLWSMLYTTGYLTQCGEDDGGLTKLLIPNREIQWIFTRQIRKWFQEDSRKDGRKLEDFCRAFLEKDAAAVEAGFTSYLRKTISIRDTGVRKDRKENFYHGILLGLLGYMGWKVRSNAEAGDGYSDIIVEVEDADIGIIIELKYAENARFDAACQEAMRQIAGRRYEDILIDDGMKTIYRYGIACYKKRCRVIVEQGTTNPACMHSQLLPPNPDSSPLPHN